MAPIDLKDDWDSLGHSDEGRRLREDLMKAAHAHSRQRAKEQLFSADNVDGQRNKAALDAMNRSMDASINALSDDELKQKFGVQSLKEVSPQSIIKASEEFYERAADLFSGKDAYTQVAAFHNLTAKNPDGNSLKAATEKTMSEVKMAGPVGADGVPTATMPEGLLDSPLDAVQMNTLYNNAMSYANTFGMDDSQALTLYASAAMGGQNLDPMLKQTPEAKDALRDLFHSIHLEMHKNPDLITDMMDRVTVDPQGNMFLNLERNVDMRHALEQERDLFEGLEEDIELEQKLGFEEDEEDLENEEILSRSKKPDSKSESEVEEEGFFSTKEKNDEPQDMMSKFFGMDEKKPKPSAKDEKEEEEKEKLEQEKLKDKKRHKEEFEGKDVDKFTGEKRDEKQQREMSEQEERERNQDKNKSTVDDVLDPEKKPEDKPGGELEKKPEDEKKPKDEKGKKEEKQDDKKLEKKDDKKMEPKRPKPTQKQVDQSEESLKMIWGGGKIGNPNGQVFLGGGHISKFQEELSDSNTKSLSRDQVSADKDWLHSSSLPNFGNRFNEQLNLQSQQKGTSQEPQYNMDNPLTRSMMEGPLKYKPDPDKAK